MTAVHEAPAPRAADYMRGVVRMALLLYNLMVKMKVTMQ
jgi:hypothetical protein